MTAQIKIDFVSDVACPWCAVGLGALEQAIARLGASVEVDMHFQPFELNPQMPPGGQDLGEHLTEKYGSTPEQRAQIYETIRQRGEAVGFTFSLEGRKRIYNTLDAHRLLHWSGYAGARGAQYALKKALLQAYQGRAENIESHAVLLAAVAEAGLDVAQALKDIRADLPVVLASGYITEEVRAKAPAAGICGLIEKPSTIEGLCEAVVIFANAKIKTAS